MRIRQSTDRFLRLRPGGPLQNRSRSVRVHPSAPGQMLDQQKRVDAARPSRGKGGHQGDDDGIRVSTEQRHPDVGAAGLTSFRVRPEG